MNVAIPVKLGERGYQIHVGAGLLSDAGALLKPFTRGKVAIVSDINVAKRYQEIIVENLYNAGIDCYTIAITAGEQSKSFSGLQNLIRFFLLDEIERNDLIVALGGGVIGDLTGFAAGVYKRGINFAQVPTTLLAQVDSSIGGKTGIDTAEGKNLVGLFHQPCVVITDTSLLSTLPKRELLGGYAEVAKYGLLGDAEFFAWLETNAAKALGGDTAALEHMVAHSCKMKAAIVSRDEREAGERALLNLGHTFGHALEAATNYSVSHGEGVAIGCVLAFELSARLKYCTQEDAERVRRHFAAIGLPTNIKQISGKHPSPDQLLEFMRHDKKASGGRMTFILARGIGRAFAAHDVPEEAVRAVLAQG